MKKNFTLILLVVSLASNAQFGARTGVELQTIKIDSESFSNIGFFAGLFYNWQLSERFSLRPEVQYIYSTGSYDVSNFNNTTLLSLSSQIEGGTMLSYRFKERWFVSGGAVATIFVAQVDPNMNDTALGAKIGVGYALNEKSGIQFNTVLNISQNDEFSTGNISKQAFKLSYIYLF